MITLNFYNCILKHSFNIYIALFFRCENETKFKTEEVFWAYNFCPTPYSWTALLGLILYLVFFAPGKQACIATVVFIKLSLLRGDKLLFLKFLIYCSLENFNSIFLRNGTDALDCEFWNISPLGKKYRKCVLVRNKLDFQCSGFTDVFTHSRVPYILW